MRGPAGGYRILRRRDPLHRRALRSTRRLIALVTAITTTAIAVSLATADDRADAAARTFFVACRGGSDANAGDVEQRPWASLGAVSARTFTPGTTIGLQRGCTFDGGITLRGNGTNSAPVTLTAFGTGATPVVTNARATGYGNGIDVQSAFAVIAGIAVANVPNAGIALTATNATVRDVEVSNTGLGVEVTGAGRAIIDRVRAHDLRMALNTRGGDDDYGAVGFVVQAPNVEIRNSSCVNCSAPSFDFGSDGGFVEVYDHGDNLYVHHNRTNNTNGFVEVGGGSAGGSADNMRFTHNTIVNASNLVNVHVDDHFSLAVRNLQFANNTVYQSVTPSQSLFYSAGGAVTAENNIIASTVPLDSGAAPAKHAHNLYFGGGSTRLGYTLGTAESFADPKFVDATRGDFRLQATSPAKRAGTGGNDLGAGAAATTTTTPPTTVRTSTSTTVRLPVATSTTSTSTTVRPPATIAPTPGHGALRNVETATVLDVQDARTQAGTPVIGWSDHAGANQRWRLVSSDAANGHVTIVSAGSSQCLDLTGVSAWGAMVVQNPCSSAATQSWHFVAAGTRPDGTSAFRIVNDAAGMVVTLSRNDPGVSYALVQPESGDAAQHFTWG